jgi:hypothetical protein
MSAGVRSGKREEIRWEERKRWRERERDRQK